MRTGLFGAVVVGWLLAPAGAAAAERPAADEPDHGALSELWDLKLEVGGSFALLTYAGVRDWKWGTARWRFNPEGWFAMSTGSGGQDKLGHAYSSYVLTEFFYLRLRARYGREAPVSVYPPLFAWFLMLYVEVFDGFSVDHGFAYEDLVMDTVGVSASFLRRMFPSVARIVDYRMEYFPSSRARGFHPMIDYSGQKFLVALRPGGFQAVEQTPLRFIELYLGYYTRNFQDHEPGSTKLRRLYAGVGLDLGGIVSSAYRPASTNPGDFHDHLMTAISLFQFPYPYPAATLDETRAVE